MFIVKRKDKLELGKTKIITLMVKKLQSELVLSN